MSVWASKRKAMYLFSVLGFFAVVASVPLYFALQTEPTCFDGRQNQDERGVDCGGVCELICPFDVSPLSLLWSRSFIVANGVYNAVAFIENPNFDVAVLEIPYSFQLYDSENLLIVERRGTTFISTNGITPIFEPRIQTGVRVPVRTFFEFTGPIRWHRINDPKEIVIVEQELQNADTEPRIEALVENKSLNEAKDVEVVAVVFDTAGNAMAVSQTLVQQLRGQTKVPIFFTWPLSFNNQAGRLDVIPRVPPRQPNPIDIDNVR